MQYPNYPRAIGTWEDDDYFDRESGGVAKFVGPAGMAVVTGSEHYNGYIIIPQYGEPEQGKYSPILRETQQYIEHRLAMLLLEHLSKVHETVLAGVQTEEKRDK